MKKYLLILFTFATLLVLQGFAQQGTVTVTGHVLDAQSKPVPGATVLVKGTLTGVTTSPEGAFTLKVPADATLIVSYIGYATVTVPVAGKTRLEIKMAEDTQVLDDVVVVGYGTQKRVNLTGAVATVDVDKVLGSRPVSDLGRGLQGASPGLLVTTSSGNIGTAPQINIRGIEGSINANTKPLILLDNVEIGDLMMVNPSDVESISILKDAASASIYGARGSWGVILITSKKGKKGTARVSYDNSFAWSSPMNSPEIADGADGAEFMLRAYRRTAPNQASFNILGAYYDNESIDKMRQWKQLYGGMNFSDEMIEGRDYERRNGQVYFYRPWDVDDTFLNRSSPQMKHNLSVSGGSDKTTYFASFGLMDQKGLVKITQEPDRFTRFNGTMRVETKIQKWLTLRGSLMFSNSDKVTPNFRLANSSASNEYWFNVYRYPETYPYGTVNGMPLKNIRSELEQAKMNTRKNTLGRFQVGATATFLPGWTLDADYTHTSNNTHTKTTATAIGGINNWIDPTLTKYEKSFFVAEDYVKLNSSWSQRNVGKAYTTYSKKLEDHSFKAMAGLDLEYYKNEFHFSHRSGIMSDSKPEISLSDGEQFATGYPSHWAAAGMFGRVNYSFKDRYLLEANIRRDGSSRFPSNHKWGTFYSFSAGYILSNEKFMQSVMAHDILSFLKIRGSWGSIGNNDLGSVDYLPTMNAGRSNWLLGVVNPTQVGVFGDPAETLTWETIETIDLGINAKFFKNALDVEFDVYRRNTKKMATKGLEVPNSFGTNPGAINSGELQTTGWELSISYNKQFTKDLNFNVMGTLSDQKGKITKFADNSKPVLLGTTANYQGKIMGDIWGYVTDRLFTEADFSGNNGAANPTWYYAQGVPNQDALNTNSAFHFGPGDVKYKDLNGDGEVNFGNGNNLNPGDMKVIGNTTPRYIFGLRLGLNYKGLDFSAFMQGVGKRDYWGTGSLVIPGFTMAEAVYKNQMNYWTPENPNAFYPAPSNPGSNNHNANYQPQTRYLLNMAYLRMKNITVGYTLPKRWTSKINVNRVRVFGSGENLFTIDNLDPTIDPEIQQNSVEGFNDAKSFGRTYPYFKTWSFGIQIDL